MCEKYLCFCVLLILIVIPPFYYRQFDPLLYTSMRLIVSEGIPSNIHVQHTSLLLISFFFLFIFSFYMLVLHVCRWQESWTVMMFFTVWFGWLNRCSTSRCTFRSCVFRPFEAHTISFVEELKVGDDNRNWQSDCQYTNNGAQTSHKFTS